MYSVDLNQRAFSIKNSTLASVQYVMKGEHLGAVFLCLSLDRSNSLPHGFFYATIKFILFYSKKRNVDLFVSHIKYLRTVARGAVLH